MVCNNEFYQLLLLLHQYKINDFDNIDEIKKIENIYFSCLRQHNEKVIIEEKPYFLFMYDHLLKKMSLFEKINWIFQK